MKTVEQLNKIISEAILAQTDCIDNRTKCKSNSYIDRLKLIRLYLQTEPKEEFIIQEMDRLKTLITNLNNADRFVEWLGNRKASMAMHREYRKAFNIDALEKQLETYEFIYYTNYKLN